MNNLELKLNTPVETMVKDLVLSFNNEELKTEITQMLERYNTTVYDDSNIALAKQDRAKLNNFAEQLNKGRISIGKVWDTPLLHFKAQIDELVNLVKDTSNKIGESITNYETRKKEEKLVEIQEYWNENAGNLKNFIVFDQVRNEKWLNASVSMKSVKTEIDTLIERINNDIKTIEMLNSEFEADIKVFYFRTLDLAKSLMENERIKQERAKVAATIKQTTPQPVTPVVEAPKEDEKIYTLKFEINGSKAQITALKEFLVTNKINYKKVED